MLTNNILSLITHLCIFTMYASFQHIPLICTTLISTSTLARLYRFSYACECVCKHFSLTHCNGFSLPTNYVVPYISLDGVADSEPTLLTISDILTKRYNVK